MLSGIIQWPDSDFLCDAFVFCQKLTAFVVSCGEVLRMFCLEREAVIHYGGLFGICEDPVRDASQTNLEVSEVDEFILSFTGVATLLAWQTASDVDVSFLEHKHLEILSRVYG